MLNEDVANCNPSITAFEALNEAVAVLIAALTAVAALAVYVLNEDVKTEPPTPLPVNALILLSNEVLNALTDDV